MISNYFKPLCKNKHKISDTQSFSQELSTLQPLEEDEKYVSYDVESLFTNFLGKETTDYILDQIYMTETSQQFARSYYLKDYFLNLLLNVNVLFQTIFTNKLMDVQWVPHSLLLSVISTR